MQKQIPLQRALTSHQRGQRNLMRDESGVIAIIVALSISTFLLGFAALAVDLGTAYVRKAELKSIADKLALAAAAQLPTIQDGVTSALDVLGKGAAGGNPATGLCADLDLPGVCDAPPGWATNTDPGDGQITFYADQGQEGELADLHGDGVLNTLDAVGPGVTTAVGVRVLLPPSKVPFGLASSLGFDSASLQQSATARIGTPLGSGILPFGLTQTDLGNGQFCVRDPALPPVLPTNPVPPGSGLFFLNVVGGEPVDSNMGTPQPVQVSITPDFGVPNSIQIHFSTDPTPATATRSRLGQPFRVLVPPGDPGTSIRVWATFRSSLFGLVTTWSDILTYSGTSPSGISPCTLPQANRGFLQLARSSTGDTLDALEQNVRTGPEVKLYPTGGNAGVIGQTTGCVSTLLTSPATTCLSTVLSQPFATQLTNGMFQTKNGRPGRLTGDCGGGTYSPHGYSNVDAMKLLDVASPLVDTSKGQVSGLQASILSGATPTPDQQGWIRSKALTCGRLAVMPILDQTPLTSVAGLQQNITGLTYVWIDDDGSGRGLAWSGNRLRSFRGYIINPKLLPDLVAGSPVVGPYLGDGMPKEAMLIPDLPAA